MSGLANYTLYMAKSTQYINIIVGCGVTQQRVSVQYFEASEFIQNPNDMRIMQLWLYWSFPHRGLLDPDTYFGRPPFFRPANWKFKQ